MGRHRECVLVVLNVHSFVPYVIALTWLMKTTVTLRKKNEKNWDGCQFGHFTLHASGHNPRDIQSKRYRQRVNHKFRYYVDKFEKYFAPDVAGVREVRPVSIDIKEIVSNCKD
ncbi:MAG: 4Fe-4S dicluster domain-containing protein [Ignavibacteria bacterium]|nr:4Fe-4S dicluster domain-containing protein [Ignavibacteria bacterium]